MVCMNQGIAMSDKDSVFEHTNMFSLSDFDKDAKIVFLDQEESAHDLYFTFHTRNHTPKACYE